MKVRGPWVYLYRAVDQAGQTVDFYGSRQRDVNAAKAFLRQAMKPPRIATKITLDAYAASPRAVADWKQAGELPKRVKVRSSKYLNHLIETGSWAREAAAWPDAGTEEFSNRRGGYRRHRVSRENPKGAVQNGQAGRIQGNDTGDLASCPGCLTWILLTQSNVQDRLNTARPRICTRAYISNKGLTFTP